MMSATTLNRALEYLGYATGAVTGHDFRATASTRLHEMGYNTEWIERQLAHVERNKAKAAYNHAEYLTERRSMMQAWADWVDQIETELRAAGKIRPRAPHHLPALDSQ
jgi:integrase